LQAIDLTVIVVKVLFYVVKQSKQYVKLQFIGVFCFLWNLPEK